MPRKQREPSSLRILFGQRLRTARQLQGLTIDDVANAADIDWSYLSQLERGNRNVGLDLVAALAEAVGLAPHDLLDPAYSLDELRQDPEVEEYG